MESSPRVSRFTERVWFEQPSPPHELPAAHPTSTAVLPHGDSQACPSPPSRPPKPLVPQPQQETPYSAFPTARRRLVLGLVTAAGFLGPLSGTIYLPAIPLLAEDLGVSVVAVDATVSVFMAVFAFAPLFWASLADYKGRRPLYVASLGVYVVANVLLAAVPASCGALVVLRIVQAVGAAAVVSLGAGTVTDLFPPARRATAMSHFLLGPQLGPIIGPVLGGALAGVSLAGPEALDTDTTAVGANVTIRNTAGTVNPTQGWRWIFALLALCGMVLLFAMLFLLPETLRSRVGNGACLSSSSGTSTDKYLLLPPRLTTPPAPADERGPPSPVPSLRGLVRLLVYPAVGLISLCTALLYASWFAIAVQLPVDLGSSSGKGYGLSSAAVGAAYLPSGIGMVVGGLVSGLWGDAMRRWRAEKMRTRDMERQEKGGDVEGAVVRVTGDKTAVDVPPECRLRDSLWAVLVLSVGCSLYGWLVQARVHVAAVLAATFFVGFSHSFVFVSTSSFLSELLPRQAAAAFSLGNMLRNPAAAVAAVVVGPLVERIGGPGWCFTGLALMDAVCVGGLLLLAVLRGRQWREKKAEADERKRREAKGGC